MRRKRWRMNNKEREDEKEKNGRMKRKGENKIER